MKKLLLLLSLVSGFVGSSIGAQSPMTLYGLNLETKPYIVAETLHSDMRLTCADDYAWTINELVEFRGRFVTCTGWSCSTIAGPHSGLYQFSPVRQLTSRNGGSNAGFCITHRL